MDREGEHQGRRGIVGDDLGDHEGQAVNRRQRKPGAAPHGGGDGVGQRLGRPGLDQRSADAERCPDGQQHLPVDRPPGLGNAAAPSGQHQAGSHQRGLEHGDLADHRQRAEVLAQGDQCHHPHHDAQRGQGPIVPGRRRVLQPADQKEVAAVAVAGHKRRMRLQQERIPRPQHDVADFAPNPLPMPGHGNDHGVVDRAEPAVANGPPHHRATVAGHRLDQTPLRTRRIELEHLVGRRDQAANLLKVHHRIDHAHEYQPVIGPQDFLRSHRRQDRSVAVDFGQIHAGQVPQPRLLDRLAHQRATRLDEHFHGVLAGVGHRADGGLALGQKPSPGQHHKP